MSSKLTPSIRALLHLSSSLNALAAIFSILVFLNSLPIPLYTSTIIASFLLKLLYNTTEFYGFL